MQEESKVWIYGLYDKGEDMSKIRYVGISKRPLTRLNEHRLCPSGSLKDKWIEDLHGRGSTVGMVILDEADCRRDALEKEYSWILFGRMLGWDLLNIAEHGIENGAIGKYSLASSVVDMYKRNRLAVFIRELNDRLCRVFWVSASLSAFAILAFSGKGIQPISLEGVFSAAQLAILFSSASVSIYFCAEVFSEIRKGDRSALMAASQLVVRD